MTPSQDAPRRDTPGRDARGALAHRTVDRRFGLDRFRRPEYTGENRCLPCTVVNVGIASVLAVAVGGVVAVELGVFVFVASLAAIWLRGYLVPGTPELTKRYLPERVLRLFGKGRASSPPTAVDAESYLLSSSVLVDTPDGGDLAFAPWFASAWRSQLAALRAGDSDDGGPSREVDDATDGPRPDIAALAALTDVDAALLAIDWRDGAAFARADGERIGHWESRAAFLADIAADRALADELDDWTDLPLAARSGVLGAIRLFVEQCPACDGAVVLEERVVESCCTSYDVVAGRCTACNERLFEMDLPPSVAADAA